MGTHVVYLFHMDAFRKYLKDNDLTLQDAATALGWSLSSLKKWGKARLYPPKVLPAIEEWTKGKVQGRMLRPDLYAPARRSAA